MAADVFTDTTVLRWPFTSKLKAKKLGAGGVSQTSLGLIWIDRGFRRYVGLPSVGGSFEARCLGFKRAPSFLETPWP